MFLLITCDGNIEAKDYQFYVDKYSHSIMVLGVNKSVWENIDKGYSVSAGIKMKTLDDSFALITLKEIFNLYIRENTLIGIDKVDFDEKKIVITLNKGSIYFKALKDYSDEWEIVVDGIIAKIHLEAKREMVKNLPSGLAISVFDGDVRIQKNNKNFKIKEGYGTSIVMDDESLSYFSLPDPPVADYPEDNSLITAGVNLKWNQIDGALLYRLEIAKDKEFINIVHHSESKNSSFNTSGLKDGKYYWRVSAINRRGIEGDFFDYSSFTIQKSLSKLVIEKKDERAFISDVTIEDDEKTDIPREDKTGSVVFGSVVLFSLIVLIII